MFRLELEARPQRYTWSSSGEFVLACIGYTVGLGNIWRFPYLCYKNGGGAFLVPYFVILLFCGMPLLYLELAVGQYTRMGPVGALEKICPIFKGAGLATVVVSFLLCTYYNVIVAWTLFYLFNSLRGDLPWTRCGNKWHSMQCDRNLTGNSSSSQVIPPNESKTPAQDFYDHKVLEMSEGIDRPGDMRWELVLALFVAWVLVYFAICKIFYFTAIVPYILLIAILVRSVMLDGAVQGLIQFIRPNWEAIMEHKVWIDAAAHNFHSLGIAFGTLIAYASYNKFNNNILRLNCNYSPAGFTLVLTLTIMVKQEQDALWEKIWRNKAVRKYFLVSWVFICLTISVICRDTIIISFVDSATSVLSGCVVFSTLGHLAHKQNKELDTVIADVDLSKTAGYSNGPGVLFVAYPTIFLQMPMPQVWGVLFFVLILFLALDSQFATVEVVVTSLRDSFGHAFACCLKRHEILVLIVCLVAFVCGLPNVTQGGIYFFQLMDYYAAAISLLYLAFFEVVAIVWFYGAGRLARNIQEMTGSLPSIYFRFCWWVIAPLTILAVWVFSLLEYKPLTYNRTKYPDWAEGVGWGIAFVSIACIPVLAIKAVCKAPGTSLWGKMRNAIQSHLPDDAASDNPGTSSYSLRLSVSRSSATMPPDEATQTKHGGPSHEFVKVEQIVSTV
uniref:Transporter n=1 Tax=Strigamia maritima TaxID=126957 RepID=T1IMI3_STRMM